MAVTSVAKRGDFEVVLEDSALGAGLPLTECHISILGPDDSGVSFDIVEADDLITDLQTAVRLLRERARFRHA